MDYSKLNKKEMIEIIKLNDTIISNVPIGFCITNEDGIYEFVNRAYCNIYGYTKEELIGEHFSIVTTEENTDELIKLHDKFLKEGHELQKEWVVKNKNDEKFYISVFAAKIIGKDGRPKKVTYISDITEQKNLEKKLKKANLQLKEKAIKDDLTGLYNHGETVEKLEAEINRSSHTNSPLTIMMLDIDDFRKVNNQYGHVVGDRVLEEMAAKIKANIRKMDVAGRIGGDEMLIIFPETDLKEAKKIAKRVLKNIREEKIEGIKVTFSSGLYQYKSEQANDLIAKADELMYKAKNKRKNEIIIAEN